MTDTTPKELRNRVMCRHFEMDLGEAAFSEYTPGVTAHCTCGKNHWTMNHHWSDDIDFRDIIRRHLNCRDFDIAELRDVHLPRP